ncbi:BatA domain-containing protein [Candidatus Woesearchaeota archaeon]|nr:BatA domain-containing protein [Candidatus Woesearchaeota archaeon]
MVLNLGFVSIQNPSQLYWLLLAIPLIIFYLIRPKPKEKEIPSLMFFMRATGRNKLLSFFRIFVRDFMMLVQLLIILALAATPSQPSSKVEHDIAAANTVIVLDGSASMQTIEDGDTRFELAIDAAKDSLSTHNTIIVASERAVLGAQDVNDRDATGYLNLLKPGDSGSRIGDSIILAGEILRGKEGRVVVISDFISTAGVEPELAMAVLRSRGLVVNAINVAEGDKRNVGFVDLLVEDDVTTAYVKNFNDEEATVTMRIAEQDKQLTISAKGVEPYVFQTLPGINELKIVDDDDFPVDNVVRTSAPERRTVKVLLISNKPSVFLQNALQASPSVELTITQPPVITKGDYDVYVVHDVDKAEVLAGTYEDLLDKAEDGKTVIVAAQDSTLDIDYKGLVPFYFMGLGENGFSAVDTPTRFTKNIEFGKLPTYFTTNLQQGVVPVVTAGNGSGIITAATVPGGGKLIWYGILEKGSDFKFSPYYPIFWHELLKFATDQKDIRGMNDRTGNTYLLDKTLDVSTPSGPQTTNRLSFDKAGLYRLPDRTIAVNLLSEKESDVNPRVDIGESAGEIELRPVRETRTMAWEVWLIAASFVILFVELLYVKLRGDV